MVKTEKGANLCRFQPHRGIQSLNYGHLISSLPHSNQRQSRELNYFFRRIFWGPLYNLSRNSIRTKEINKDNDEAGEGRSSRNGAKNAARSFVLHVWVAVVHRVLCRTYSCRIQDSGAATVDITNNKSL